ncbi:MAG: sulfatase [Acidobacteria bacterium]|nr:sulfatase [Acidobacteriota bacterium]
MMTRRSLLASLAAQSARPNIVFVLVDDLRWDELGCTGHPFASTPNCDRLAREGASFVNAFSVVPLCSPSRASFLTGQYPHRHGIIDNTNRSAASHKLITWPRLLHDAGYETAFIGKWHMGNDDSPRPGFDSWVSFKGQGECIDPDLNVNGKAVSTHGYITDLLTDHAVDFIDKRRARPFCLYLSHKAVHPNIQQRDDGSTTGGGGDAEFFIPAPRHAKLYDGMIPPRRANYKRPPKNQPALEQKIEGLPPLGDSTATPDSVILNRMRMMKAVDESLGRVVAALERANQLDNTIVVMTGDHGYFYGEHSLAAERRLAYEETIRIPLLIRYPASAKAGSKPAHVALSIDIAPTMLTAAGLRAPAQMQGHSLFAPKRRDDFLIEYYSDTVFPRIRKMGYKAVRSRDWKYIHYTDLNGADELYDLARDPFEMNNLIADPAARRLLRTARARLALLAKD